MKSSENTIITKNSPRMVAVKVIYSILPILYIMFNFLGSDEETEGASILAEYPLHCLAIAAVLLLLAALFYFLDWKTKALYQYSDRLIYAKGIINKMKITIRYENMSTVDIHRPLIYRFFGLAMLKIDSNTVSAENVGKSEVVLILTKALAAQKKTELLNAVTEYERAQGNAPSVAVPTDKTPLLVLSRGKVILMMSLSVLMMLIILVPFAVSAVFSVLIPYLHFPNAGIILFTVLGLVGFTAIVLGVTLISTLLMYHNFVLYQSPRRLHLSYGLMDIKNITIPYRKINGLKLNQNLLQRFMGLCSVSVLSAGYGDEKNELRSVIAPSATKEEAMMIVKQVYGDLPDFSKKTRPTGSAVFLYFFPSIILSLISYLAVHFNMLPLLPVSAIGGVIIAFSVIAGFLQLINTSLSREGSYCRLEKGGIFRSVVFLPISRCQMLTMKSGPIQRLFGKGTVKFGLFTSSAGFSSSISLRHMNKKLAGWFFK